jgi:predicted nucleic-acid-binding protein
MSRTAWVDTNVILRYLLNDHPDHSARALALIGSAERGERLLRIPAYVICETIYILENQAYTREQIHDALTRFTAIPGIHVERLAQVHLALIWYRDKNVDFGDALLYAECSEDASTVLTFNKRHFQRLGTGWEEP